MKIVVAFLVLVSVGVASAQTRTKAKSAYENLVYSKPCASASCEVVQPVKKLPPSKSK